MSPADRLVQAVTEYLAHRRSRDGARLAVCTAPVGSLDETLAMDALTEATQAEEHAAEQLRAALGEHLLATGGQPQINEATFAALRGLGAMQQWVARP